MATLFALVGVVAVASPAAAHPTLVATLPEAGYSVADPPEEIGLVFDERVSVTKLIVEGQARGRIPTAAVRQSPEGTKVTVRPLRPLPVGRYTVRWQITALDGDVVEGAFGFGVGTTATSPERQAATVTSGMATAAVFRWALFLALALALGGLVGERLARRHVTRAQSTVAPPPPWLLPATLIGVVATLALALHQLGGGKLSEGFGRASPAALLASPAGVLVAVELLAFVASAAAAAARIRPLVALPLLVVVVAEAQRTHLQSAAGALGVVTIIVHLVAAAIWVGALLYVVRTAIAWRHQPRHMRTLFAAYARVALAVYAFAVAAGILAAVLVLLPSPRALIDTPYGWVLLVKTALVVLATVFAFTGRHTLRHRAATSPTRHARTEAVVLVTVLAASAVLTTITPPADPARALTTPSPITGPSVRLGTRTGQVMTGVIASAGHLEVRLRAPEWDPSQDQGYHAAGHLTDAQGRTTKLALRPCGAGCFTAPTRWLPGDNTVDLTVGVERWRGGTARFTVPWPVRNGRALFDRARTAMARQQTVTFDETSTSDTSRPTGQGMRLKMSGRDFLDNQPYRSGAVSAVAILTSHPNATEIAFSISAENIYVHLTLAPDGRLIRETLTSPNHLITRTFTYGE